MRCLAFIDPQFQYECSTGKHICQSRLMLLIKGMGLFALAIFLELQRKAESYFQHTNHTFSSGTRQSMKRRIIAKHLTEPK